MLFDHTLSTLDLTTELKTPHGRPRVVEGQEVFALGAVASAAVAEPVGPRDPPTVPVVFVWTRGDVGGPLALRPRVPLILVPELKMPHGCPCVVEVQKVSAFRAALTAVAEPVGPRDPPTVLVVAAWGRGDVGRPLALRPRSPLRLSSELKRPNGCPGVIKGHKVYTIGATATTAVAKPVGPRDPPTVPVVAVWGRGDVGGPLAL